MFFSSIYRKESQSEKNKHATHPFIIKPKNSIDECNKKTERTGVQKVYTKV